MLAGIGDWGALTGYGDSKCLAFNELDVKLIPMTSGNLISTRG